MLLGVILRRATAIPCTVFDFTGKLTNTEDEGGNLGTTSKWGMSRAKIWIKHWLVIFRMLHIMLIDSTTMPLPREVENLVKEQFFFIVSLNWHTRRNNYWLFFFFSQDIIYKQYGKIKWLQHWASARSTLTAKKDCLLPDGHTTLVLSRVHTSSKKIVNQYPTSLFPCNKQ